MNPAITTPLLGTGNLLDAAETSAIGGPLQRLRGGGKAVPGTAPESLKELSTAEPARAQQKTKLEHAAQEFESLMLAQLLKVAREAGSGDWLGSGKGQGGNPTLELAETQLARVMAQSGALGFSRLLVKGLSETPAHPGSSNAAVPPPASAAESSAHSPVIGKDSSHE